MRLYNFRQLFTLLLSLTLCGFGVYLGLQLPRMSPVGPISIVQELIRSNPSYGSEVTVALGVVGFLLGIWLGPRLGDKIIGAGKSLERMSANDKIAVGAPPGAIV